MHGRGRIDNLASSGRSRIPYEKRFFLGDILKFCRVNKAELSMFVERRCKLHRSWMPYWKCVYWVDEKDFRKIVTHFLALHGAWQAGGNKERAKFKRKLGFSTKRRRKKPAP